MKVECDVTVYERNGKETTTSEGYKSLILRSHWNRKTLVVLQFGDTNVTVSAEELKRAISAAQAAHAY